MRWKFKLLVFLQCLDKVLEVADQYSFFSGFGRERSVLSSEKKSSYSSHVAGSPTVSFPCLFLPHVTVDKVPLGTWDSCFFTLVTCENILFFLPMGGYYLPVHHSCFGALSGSHICPTRGNMCGGDDGYFFFPMQNTVLKLYKLESDPLKKLYKQL